MTKQKPVRFSVCMAVYNGGEYLEMQLYSILAQIGVDDEIIICDDNSSDSSVDIIRMHSDSRIHLHVNKERLGHVRNFEKVISLAHGEYIMLSDQDDVWAETRLVRYLERLVNCSSPTLVVGNFIEVDNDLNPLKSAINQAKLAGGDNHQLPISISILLGRSKYYGCCFAFHRSLLIYVLPFPRKIEAHDMWIGLVASLFASVSIINEVTLLRRIHGNNVTPRKRRSIKPIAHSRLVYFRELLIVLVRVYCGKWSLLSIKSPIK